MMPHVDGWEMLRRIQEQYGVGAIPVVMFSGKADEQAPVAGGIESGAHAFVGKPFDLQLLIDQTEADSTRLTGWDRELGRWVVHHRFGPFDRRLRIPFEDRPRTGSCGWCSGLHCRSLGAVRGRSCSRCSPLQPPPTLHPQPA